MAGRPQSCSLDVLWFGLGCGSVSNQELGPGLFPACNIRRRRKRLSRDARNERAAGVRFYRRLGQLKGEYHGQPHQPTIELLEQDHAIYYVGGHSGHPLIFGRGR